MKKESKSGQLSYPINLLLLLLILLLISNYCRSQTTGKNFVIISDSIKIRNGKYWTNGENNEHKLKFITDQNNENMVMKFREDSYVEYAVKKIEKNKIFFNNTEDVLIFFNNNYDSVFFKGYRLYLVRIEDPLKQNMIQSSSISLGEINNNNVTNNDFYTDGLIKYKNSDYDGAIIDFTKVIKSNPKDAKAYTYRGISKYYSIKNMDKSNNEKNYSSAILDLDFAVQYTNPIKAEAYEYRARIKSEQKKYSEALNDINKAIILNSDASCYCLRGTLQKNLGNKQEACSDFSKAYELGYKDCLTREAEYCKDVVKQTNANVNSSNNLMSSNSSGISYSSDNKFVGTWIQNYTGGSNLYSQPTSKYRIKVTIKKDGNDFLVKGYYEENSFGNIATLKGDVLSFDDGGFTIKMKVLQNGNLYFDGYELTKLP